jgi:ABC-type Fe3+-hydroxamate transport system substrate-binding protein
MIGTVEKPGIAVSDLEDITRRDFLVGGAGLLALGVAGCGRGETGDSSSETRTVDTPRGPVELPVNPRRVVAMYTTDVDHALALDLPLVGGGTARGLAGQPFAGYQPEEELEDVQRLQTYPEANYEQIAAVEPDCILDSVSDEAGYERLSRIAPTLFYENTEEVEGIGWGRPDWRGSLRTVGGAFDRADEAERFVAGYEERAAGLRERLAGRWAGATFASVFPSTDHLRVQGSATSHPHRILAEDLGLTLAPVVTQEDQELSLEALPQVDADVLFLALFPREDSLERDRESAAPYTNSPLWSRLPAVRKGQVYEYDAELIYISPLTAEAFLGVVERSLLA